MLLYKTFSYNLFKIRTALLICNHMCASISIKKPSLCFSDRNHANINMTRTGARPQPPSGLDADMYSIPNPVSDVHSADVDNDGYTIPNTVPDIPPT